MMKHNRIVQFEFLRILASFFVVLIHVTTIGMRESDSSIFLPNACLNALSRWAVPIFFMVSGAVLLDPAKDSPPPENNSLCIQRCAFRSRLGDVLFFLDAGYVHTAHLEVHSARAL